MTDVITVPSHTKKDNPKAALKPHPRRQRRGLPLRRHLERPGTEGRVTGPPSLMCGGRVLGEWRGRH